MTRRLALCGLVVAALAAALLGGFLAPRPPGRPPAYALGSALVWHAEIAALLFAALYGAIVTIRLAYHGLTFTHVGSRGVDIPQLHEGLEKSEDTEISIDDIVTTLDLLKATARETEHRLWRLERTRDVLLNPDEEAT